MNDKHISLNRVILKAMNDKISVPRNDLIFSCELRQTVCAVLETPGMLKHLILEYDLLDVIDDANWDYRVGSAAYWFMANAEPKFPTVAEAENSQMVARPIIAAAADLILTLVNEKLEEGGWHDEAAA